MSQKSGLDGAESLRVTRFGGVGWAVLALKKNGAADLHLPNRGALTTPLSARAIGFVAKSRAGIIAQLPTTSQADSTQKERRPAGSGDEDKRQRLAGFHPVTAL